MAAKEMTEAQMVNLVRNALLVAGHEMGAEGDHWPVIKSTIHSVMKDWEELQVERNVHEQLKAHLARLLNEIESGIAECSEEAKPKIEKGLSHLREIYDAYFTSVSRDALILKDEDIPLHIKRVEAIVGTLGGQNE